MPTKTYARVDHLKEKLGNMDDTVTDADLQELLEEGHREMEAAVGRNYTQRYTFDLLKSDGETLDNTITLNFRPVFQIDQVIRIPEHETVDAADYTVDKETGTVTIDSTFVHENIDRGDTLRIQYVPVIFRDLEVWYAILENKTMEMIQFDDSEEANLYENAAVKVQKLTNRINSRVPPGSVTDGRTYRGTP